MKTKANRHPDKIKIIWWKKIQICKVFNDFKYEKMIENGELGYYFDLKSKKSFTIDGDKEVTIVNGRITYTNDNR